MPKKPSYHHGDLKNALIEAGADVLAREGVAALSLRRVAQKAGVSHAAPYAHFTDKQALIAAISTEGYRRLYEAMSDVIERFAEDPGRQLMEGAWAYVQFAQNAPDHFKVTMSGVVERQKEYPAFVEMSQRNLALLVRVVEACQGAGVLRKGPPELVALSVWSVVHGFVSLLLEQQIPHTVLDQKAARELLAFMLNQQTLVELKPPATRGKRSG
jgi:AcrR family transcriptional regulator